MPPDTPLSLEDLQRQNQILKNRILEKDKKHEEEILEKQEEYEKSLESLRTRLRLEEAKCQRLERLLERRKNGVAAVAAPAAAAAAAAATGEASEERSAAAAAAIAATLVTPDRQSPRVRRLRSDEHHDVCMGNLEMNNDNINNNDDDDDDGDRKMPARPRELMGKNMDNLMKNNFDNSMAPPPSRAKKQPPSSHTKNGNGFISPVKSSAFSSRSTSRLRQIKTNQGQNDNHNNNDGDYDDDDDDLEAEVGSTQEFFSSQESTDDGNYVPGESLNDRAVWEQKKMSRKRTKIAARKSPAGKIQKVGTHRLPTDRMYPCPVRDCKHTIAFSNCHRTPLDGAVISDKQPWAQDFDAHAFQMRKHMLEKHPDVPPAHWPRGFSRRNSNNMNNNNIIISSNSSKNRSPPEHDVVEIHSDDSDDNEESGDGLYDRI